MQTALTSAATPNVVPLTPSKSVSHLTSFPAKLTGSLAPPRFTAIKVATVNYDTSTVDYTSAFSVFPVEACETIGGDACLAEMYPEVKLKPEARNNTPRDASENVEREYLEYNDPKTVFQAEACDDLGGIFCELEYQKGVY
ncbi:light-regulated protein, chloroplastic-like [Lotus japonicus]|uniref:Light regulated Lir1 n=1 Tax=Lotus japonicus TaxID=34305 RepID=I3TAS9_LOTJA|nr:light-regulated protein, chloroplastic-like [Lotus japonicus]AFK49621.1 unknown [Lotus japonicus]